jgi:hypothetical protein
VTPVGGGDSPTIPAMFFRGRQHEASIWRRFRTSADSFTFDEANGIYTAHVVANAERVVDLVHTLAEHLPPAVDVAIEDLRSGRSWRGESVALPDVRDSVARLKLLLARYGGVELAIYTADDQLAINPYLELFIYARSDRWLYLLEGKGLEQQATVQPRSWKTTRKQFPAAPDLVNALATTADRLGLAPA